MQPSYWHYPRYTTLHQSEVFKPCWLVSLIYCSRVYFTWLNVEKLRGTRWRFSYLLNLFIQLFIVFSYFLQCPLSPLRAQFILVARLSDFVPWEARLRWKVRAYDTVSLCYNFNDKSLLKLRCCQITERERQLSVCWCVFFYECCHSYMRSWVSALMVTRLWYRHRWRSQQRMQWSQTYFKSKLCCMSPVNLK